MFSKILIANRGEIACRIARTCRRLGVAVAGVHSEADASALHVKVIGESFAIGGAAASDSYLRGDAIIAAAKACGAQAIHPGYGFLAENAAFAREVERAGLVFIGPHPETIERLGDKASAKQEAIAAGVRTVPGSAAPSEDVAAVVRSVRELGGRVMLKAAAGGGGKGMRAVTAGEDLQDEIEAAMREARSAFGNGALIVERLVEHGRHVEVQIAGDGRGDVIHLFERECTLQRRHQKLIEEAPAAALPPGLRERLLADAVRLGVRLAYRGVGTVEFIVSGDEHYFLEVNPRLQVEHPVTELVTGIDIVELMLRIAAGDGLGIAQREVRCEGVAVEARICAEDAAENFMPATGPITLAEFPDTMVRVESGIETGSEVTPWYDSLLAKLVAAAPTRSEALDRLSAALGVTTIFGVTTNIGFLQRLIALPATRDATFHTRLIDEQTDALTERSAPGTDAMAIAACYWMLQQRPVAATNPWLARTTTGWQMRAAGESLSQAPLLHLETPGSNSEIRFAPLQADGTLTVGIGGLRIAVRLDPAGDGRFLAHVGTRRETVRLQQDGHRLFVRDARGCHDFTALPYLGFAARGVETSAELLAPMTGSILKVQVAPGQPVKRGDVAIVMESMKMELRVASEIDGMVSAVHCAAGDTVERRTVLVVVDREGAATAGGTTAAVNR